MCYRIHQLLSKREMKHNRTKFERDAKALDFSEGVDILTEF